MRTTFPILVSAGVLIGLLGVPAAGWFRAG